MSQYVFSYHFCLKYKLITTSRSLILLGLRFLSADFARLSLRGLETHRLYNNNNVYAFFFCIYTMAYYHVQPIKAVGHGKCYVKINVVLCKIHIYFIPVFRWKLIFRLLCHLNRYIGIQYFIIFTFFSYICITHFSFLLNIFILVFPIASIRLKIRRVLGLCRLVTTIRLIFCYIKKWRNYFDDCSKNFCKLDEKNLFKKV